MSEWRPIESAPKDGTKIDLWIRNFKVGAAGRLEIEDIGRTTDAWWGEEVYVYHNPYERREGEIGWVSHKDICNHEPVETGGFRATHWMPLPPPPGSGIESE